MPRTYHKEFVTLSEAVRFVSENAQTINPKYPGEILGWCDVGPSGELFGLTSRTRKGMTHIQGIPIYESRDWDALFNGS